VEAAFIVVVVASAIGGLLLCVAALALTFALIAWLGRAGSR